MENVKEGINLVLSTVFWYILKFVLLIKIFSKPFILQHSDEEKEKKIIK